MCVGRGEEGGEHERERESKSRREGEEWEGDETLASAPGFDVETEY